MARQDKAQAILGLGAVAMRDRLASGALRAVDLVEACLARIAELEPQVGAWAWLDGDHALEQARRLDHLRQSGKPVGPLHGLPVGLKDIIDTKGIPTENGTPIDAGRVPSEDAWIVARLRAAGAIILGKTVTTECAFMHPGKTRNPHNSAHTPGGSSQGSAAAVAAGMVPFSVGTQTGGSVIRPASFCGIVGLKSTFGLIPRTGILPQSPFLDTVGVFARSVEDCALLAEVLAGHDPADTASAPMPMPRLLSVAQSNAPVLPVFAFAKLPGWDQADPQMIAATEDLVDLLGEQCFEVALPDLEDVAAIRERINFAEMAKCYYGLERRGRDLMSGKLKSAIDQGKSVLARDYIAALDWRELVNAGMDAVFARCDVLLCPAALGPAPEGLDDTGSALFNGIWTLSGMPAVTLPVFTAQNGMPMGIQLIAKRGDDARLLRTARWLAAYLENLDEEN
ncbi:amidase [Sulfitobacter guttiformis]|uniref:Asp-tRNA(Asn)/Glu-tRNA(Gln) amidotransferase A subunit family amidase n=1 Tax=Sulfitobacter guttiformis TaxID=74349 RepID=A0A420DTY3_9RHOB|nr:amidase [Sulfitobacter guttiformis]KIN71116.1 Asp-tRNA Asn/Glu-tRNA Gln amidotransferase subunit A [Sulfitobacter guttiformis KCTC 32187]RKE97599.1 Asp-tRNA(Asn)/Glu-tRNA(Gln) amidotransferase A subunit family amidase [Sulfitobacter guttiformis]